MSNVVLCGRRTFSEDALHFSWRAHFGDLQCHFAGTRATFDVSCCVFFKIALSRLRQVVTLTTPHSTLHTPHSTLHTPHFQLYTQHSTFSSLHSTLYTPCFFTSHSLHFTFSAPHSKPYTLHFTLYTVHSTLHFTLNTFHFTLNTPHFTFYTLHPTLNTPRFTLYTPHCTFFSPRSRSTLYTLHSIVYTAFLFSHNYDSGVRSPTCGHSGLWASSCFSGIFFLQNSKGRIVTNECCITINYP